MEEENEQTTIRVLKTTRDRIAKLGKKNESFEEIITRMLDAWDSEWFNAAYESYRNM